MDQIRTEVTTRRRNLALVIKHFYNDSQAAFVNATGINQGELSALLKNKSFGEKKARKIEADAKLPKGILDTENFDSLLNPIDPREAPTPSLSTEETSRTYDAISGVERLTSHTGEKIYSVPLLNWDEVDLIRNAPSIDRIKGRPVIATTSEDALINAFALRVKGNSMEREKNPSFAEGDILICTREAEVTNGAFVIARPSESGDIVFKQLVQDGANWYLESLNPKYPLIPIQHPRLCVIAKVRQRLSVSHF